MSVLMLHRKSTWYKPSYMVRKDKVVFVTEIMTMITKPLMWYVVTVGSIVWYEVIWLSQTIERFGPHEVIELNASSASQRAQNEMKYFLLKWTLWKRHAVCLLILKPVNVKNISLYNITNPFRKNIVGIYKIFT